MQYEESKICNNHSEQTQIHSNSVEVESQDPLPPSASVDSSLLFLLMAFALIYGFKKQ